MTNVELTDEQAALFILFMGNYDAIAFMISQGVFEIRSGNAILSFDKAGTLKSIKRELYGYVDTKGVDNSIALS